MRQRWPFKYVGKVPSGSNGRNQYRRPIFSIIYFLLIPFVIPCSAWEWSEPIRFDPSIGGLNTPFYWEAGQRIYYSHAFPDNTIGVLKKVDGIWTGPFSLGSNVNLFHNGEFPRISKNGKVLIFLYGRFLRISHRENIDCDSCWSYPIWMEVPDFPLINIEFFDFSSVDSSRIYIKSWDFAHGLFQDIVSMKYDTNGIADSVEVYRNILPYESGDAFGVSSGDSTLFYAARVRVSDTLYVTPILVNKGKPGIWNEIIDTIPDYYPDDEYGITVNSTGRIIWGNWHYVFSYRYQIDSASSVAQLEKPSNNRVTFFPNPVVSTVSIQGNINNKKISITDLSGQQYVASPEIGNRGVSYLDLSVFRTGVYIITVTDVNNITEIHRITKI